MAGQTIETISPKLTPDTVKPDDPRLSFAISPTDFEAQTGLDFDENTGRISGTASLTAMSNALDYTITVLPDTGYYKGTPTAAMNIKVIPVLTATWNAITATAFTPGLFGPPSLDSTEWTGSFSAASLPDGLDINPKTGEISGAPNGIYAADDYQIELTGRDDYFGVNSSAMINIRVNPKDLGDTGFFITDLSHTVVALTEDSAALSIDKAGLTHTDDYTLSISPDASGNIRIDNDGTISIGVGITVSDTRDYTITATGTGNYTGTVEETFTLTVNSRTLTPAMLGSISTTDFTIKAGFANAETRTLNFDASLTVGTDYTIAITERPPDAKPDHLSLDAATGVLTLSTAIAPDDSGEYTLTVSAAGNYTDPATPLTAAFRLTVTKADILSITYSPVTAVFKTAMAQSADPTIEPADAAAGARFTISPDLNADTGLSFDPATGAISGTPTIRASGDYSVSIEGGDGTKYEGSTLTSASFSVSIDPKPIEGTLSYDGSSIDTTYGTGQALRIQWTGDLPEQTVTYAIAPADPADPALPDDILFTTGTGALSVSNMTAVHTGTYTVTASGSGDYGGTKTVDVNIKIDPKALETADFTVKPSVTVTALTANEIPDVMTSNLAVGTDYTLDITSRPGTANDDVVSIDNDGKVSTTEVITIAAAGSYTVTASGNGNYSGTATGTFTLTVNPKELTSALLGSISTTDFTIQAGFANAETRTLNFDASLTVGTDYTLAITGRPPDAKPGHLSLDAATAVLTLSTNIAPDDSGEYTVTVSAAGSYTDPSTPLTAVFRLTVTKADILFITYSPVTAIFKTAMAQSASPTIEPADAAVNASFTISPDLHTNTGLSFDPATGAISGTPTIRASGDYSVRIKGKDGTKYEGAELTSASFSVSIDPKPIEGTLSYDGSSIATTYGTAQALSIQWTGDLPEQTVTYAIAPADPADPALPDDILFTTGTGALSVSNLTAVHTGSYTVTASGSVDYTGTKSVDVNIKIEPKALSDVSGFSITGSGTVTALTGGSATATVAGGLTHTSDYTLSITSAPNSNKRVTIANNAQLTVGPDITIQDAGIYTITATGQNNYGGQVTGTFNLTVNPKQLTSALLGSISNPQSDFTVAIGLTSDVTRTLSFSSSLTIGSDFSLAISSIPTDATAGHVSLDSNTGVLTISKDVVLADSGTYSLNATGKGNYSGTAAASFEFTVNRKDISGTLSYADLEIAAGQTKRSNAFWNNAASGQTVRYTLVSPPAGMSIDENIGVVTVDAAVVTADTSCSIRAEGIGNYTGETTADLKVFIRDWMAPDLTLTYTDIRVYKDSSASSSPQWSSVGPTAVYGISPLNGGTLPDEISIDPSSGDISVSSSAALQADTVYQVTATATGSWKGWKKAEIRISVYDTFSYAFQPALVGQEFILPAINAASFEQFAVSPSLPDGLDLNRDSGEISGTPEKRQLATEYTITASPTGGGSTISNKVYLFIQEQAVDKDDLWRMIDEEIVTQGNTADLGLIDTGIITDMSDLFNSYSWDISNNLANADYSAFNGDLSGWDVSSVTNMDSMFHDAEAFNGDISGWDVSSVTDMRFMFSGAEAFNGDLSGWDVSSVTSMRSMFISAYDFNGDLSGWDVSKVTDMRSMFNSAKDFNGDLSGWNVSSVMYMSFMFGRTEAFNGDLSGWNVSSVTDMRSMFFLNRNFNGDLSGWDVSSVTNMRSMFSGATAFNGDISGWDVSSVTNMRSMFSGATAFNGDISGWDVSSVTDMHEMFHYATNFNGDLSGWDVSSVTDMGYMFHDSGLANNPPSWYSP